jgi:hypothetical protein
VGILHGEEGEAWHRFLKTCFYGRATGPCGMHSATQMTSPNARL